MLQAVALTVLALSCHASALALPQVTTGSATELFPTNTTMSFYQGTSLATGHIERDITTNPKLNPLKSRQDRECGMYTGERTIQQGTCMDLLTAAVGLQQTEYGSCSFTLYENVVGCDPGPGGSTGRVIPIPNGVGKTCIGTGVVDGGMYQHASGIWVCG